MYLCACCPSLNVSFLCAYALENTNKDEQSDGHDDHACLREYELLHESQWKMAGETKTDSVFRLAANTVPLGEILVYPILAIGGDDDGEGESDGYP